MGQYNPATVFRQISNKLLKEFFEQRATLLDFDWSKPRAYDIFEAFKALPEDKSRALESVMQDVHVVASDESGILALVEEFRYRGIAPAADFLALDSRYDKAMWMHLKYPDIWAETALLVQADKLSKKSWSRRSGIPKKSPKTESLNNLGDGVSAFFMRHQCRGGKSLTEHVKRGTSQHYYFVYLSDFAGTYESWDEKDQFVRNHERRAFQVVFAYDDNAGTLDVYALGGRKVVPHLETIFAAAILEERLEPAGPSETGYDIEKLKDRNFRFETSLSDKVGNVVIKEMYLSVLGNSRKRFKIEVPPESGPEEIYVSLENDLNRQRLPLSVLQVEKVTISADLVNCGRRRKLTFELGRNSCNLKSKRDDLRIIGERLLKENGIDTTGA